MKPETVSPNNGESPRSHGDPNVSRLSFPVQRKNQPVRPFTLRVQIRWQVGKHGIDLRSLNP